MSNPDDFLNGKSVDRATTDQITRPDRHCRLGQLFAMVVTGTHDCQVRPADVGEMTGTSRAMPFEPSTGCLTLVRYRVQSRRWPPRALCTYKHIPEAAYGVDLLVGKLTFGLDMRVGYLGNNHLIIKSSRVRQKWAKSVAGW